MHPIWPASVPCSSAPSQTVFWDDFLQSTFSATNDAATYDLLAGNGTVALSDVDAGGVVIITGDATAGNETVIGQNGAPWEVHPDKAIYFEARINIADADTQDWDIGLMTENTANPQGSPPNDGVYFGAAGDANLDFVIEPGPGGTQQRTDTTLDLTDGDWIKVAFKLTSQKCLLWVDLEDGNGPQLVGTVTSGLPVAGTELQIIADNEGGALAMKIDYILCVQDRIAN